MDLIEMGLFFVKQWRRSWWDSAHWGNNSLTFKTRSVIQWSRIERHWIVLLSVSTILLELVLLTKTCWAGCFYSRISSKLCKARKTARLKFPQQTSHTTSPFPGSAHKRSADTMESLKCTENPWMHFPRVGTDSRLCFHILLFFNIQHIKILQ